MSVVHHFSEDPGIERFVPHVPPTNPMQPPAVWAIDAEHAPLYWFPRDCPRVTVWVDAGEPADGFARAFTTTARRLHAIELGWLDAMRTTALYRYDLDASAFDPWPEAIGQYVAHTAAEPLRVEPVGDLLALHAAAAIELRLVPSLWPLHDVVRSGPWPFSIVRMANAEPRP